MTTRISTRRRDFHFVFGLKEQTEPLHLVFYLALESCRQVNTPNAMHFHYRNEPYGPWWDRIRPHLTLHQVGQIDTGFGAGAYEHSREGRFIQRENITYAHEADVLRLRILEHAGGCYADMDTMFVRRYPDELFNMDFAIAEERAYADAAGVLRPSLCNAVMFARPQSSFVRRWLAAMPGRFDGTWSAHSCQAASALAARDGTDVAFLPWAWFYRFAATPQGIARLFTEVGAPRHDVFSIHLWAHLWWAERRNDFSAFHAGLINEDHVLAVDSTYNLLARAVLDNASLG